MGKPDNNHLGGRYQATITFDMPAPKPTLKYLNEFIKEALESAGGCRHPDDPLFHSLGQVTVGTITQHRKSKRSKPK
jgi:hypothetical protein